MEAKEKTHQQSPLELVLRVTSSKWTIPVLNNLVDGARRPAELAKILHGINPKILTERLRELEKWGLIDRKEYKEIPPRVEYSLTLRGRELLQAIAPIKDLSERWVNGSGYKASDGDAPDQGAHVNNFSFDEQSTNHSLKEKKAVKVYLIGTGPGTNDLLTVRAAKILSQAHMVIYSATSVSEAVLDHCSLEAELIDIDTFTLEEKLENYIYAKEKSLTVARLYSGDPTVFASAAEQINVLNTMDIEYEIIPGVSSFTAAAASVGCSLTKIPVSESIILTHLPARAISNRGGAPKQEDLERLDNLAVHKSTMCIYLSANHIAEALSILTKHYSWQTPGALICHPKRLDEQKHIGTLESILASINLNEWQDRTAVMLVGDVMQSNNLSPISNVVNSAKPIALPVQ